MKRRAMLLGGVAVGTGSLGWAAEPAWPLRPITMLVASAAGGALDATARVLQPRLAALLGEAIIIDNRSGGGGVVAVEAAARATADGHTILLAHLGGLVINGLIRGEGAIDPLLAFEPISLAVEVPSILVVPASKPWRSLQDMIKDARAKPGSLSWGHSGVGSTNHLSGALLDRKAEIETVGVPYRGGGPLALDLIAGRLDYSFTTSASILPHVEAGRLRVLATPSLKRSAFLPDVPTVAEQGMPGFEATAWFGVLAPAATPPAIIARLGAELDAIGKEAEFRSRIAGFGAEPPGLTPDGGSSPESFGVFLRAEIARWTDVVRRADIRVE